MTEEDPHNTTHGERLEEIPEQVPIAWMPAIKISWRGMRRRFLRSLITMFGVILAIAFLAYVLITEELTQSLVEANDEALNVLLQQAGVDIYAATGANEKTMLLICLSLMACLAGVINAMLMSVTERIKEIGTLKCLGAMDSFIVKIFFIESSLQGIIGTAIGMTAGLLIAVLAAVITFQSHAMRYFPVVASLKAVAITFVAGSLISIVAAIAPAAIAARKKPVDAMRVEE